MHTQYSYIMSVTLLRKHDMDNSSSSKFLVPHKVFRSICSLGNLCIGTPHPLHPIMILRSNYTAAGKRTLLPWTLYFLILQFIGGVSQWLPPCLLLPVGTSLCSHMLSKLFKPPLPPTAENAADALETPAILCTQLRARFTYSLIDMHLSFLLWVYKSLQVEENISFLFYIAINGFSYPKWRFFSLFPFYLFIFLTSLLEYNCFTMVC